MLLNHPVVVSLSLARTPRHARHSSDCLHRDCAAADRRCFEAIRHGGNLCFALHRIPSGRFSHFARVRREASRRAHSDRVDLFGPANFVWRVLPACGATGALARSLFGIDAAGSGITNDGSPCVCRSYGARCHPCTDYAGDQHSGYAVHSSVFCIRIHRPRADALASHPRAEAVYDPCGLSAGGCGDALFRGVRHHSTLFGSDQRAQYSPRFRIRCRRHGECGKAVRGRTFHDDRNRGAGFCGVFLRARLDGYRFCESGPRAELRARAYGFATEYGIDAGSNCRRLAGRDLALLCPCPVPNLPLTVFLGAAGAAIDDR